MRQVDITPIGRPLDSSTSNTGHSASREEIPSSRLRFDLLPFRRRYFDTPSNAIVVQDELELFHFIQKLQFRDPTRQKV